MTTTCITGTVKNLPRRKSGKILSDDMRQFIDDEMGKDDEVTSTKLKEMIEGKWTQVKVSLATIKQERQQLGWRPLGHITVNC